MKRVIIYLLMLFATQMALGQQKPPYERTHTSQVLSDWATWSRYYMGVPHGTTPSFPAYVPDSLKCGALFYVVNPGVDTVLNVYNCLSSSWVPVGSGSGSSAISGFTVTTTPSLGQVITSGTSDNVIKQLFNGAQPPTAALSGGTANEKSTSNFTHNLSWTYGRLLATGNIVSADITPGAFHEFGTQPAAPGSVSGSQSVTTTANTNTTYTLLVTDANSKTASFSTTDTWYDKKYYGWVTDTTNIHLQGTYNDATLRALTTDNAGSTKAASFNPGSTTAEYLVYMYPASDGVLTSITINALPSIAAFQHVSRNFTNASGYTQTYLIYWTINAQTTTGYPVATN